MRRRLARGGRGGGCSFGQRCAHASFFAFRARAGAAFFVVRHGGGSSRTLYVALPLERQRLLAIAGALVALAAQTHHAALGLLAARFELAALVGGHLVLGRHVERRHRRDDAVLHAQVDQRRSPLSVLEHLR